MELHSRGRKRAKHPFHGPAGARDRIVFFRDDDVDELTDELVEFVNFFLTAKVPVNYQIVPGKLRDDTCEFMLDKRQSHPELIRLNQHGYMHEHVINGVHTWFEYSGNRPYADQHQSIQNGQRLLREKLGRYFDDRVFTPPGHKFDENTLRALEALDFQILSASSYTSLQARLYYGVGKLLRSSSLLGKRISYHGQTLPAHDLREISVAIDVDMSRDLRGETVVKSSSGLLREFQQAGRCTRVVGIVTHHSGYDAQRMETLREFITSVSSIPRLSFRLIEDIAEELSSF